MGFIEHFKDDTKLAVPDNPNLYIPIDVMDGFKRKAIYDENGWNVCYIDNKEIKRFESFLRAKLYMENL